MSACDDATVLLIDDVPDTLDIFRSYLEEYETRTATCGDEALTKLEPTVDVVLLDRQLPEMSGKEVLREIRRRDTDWGVVMVTAIGPGVDLLEMPVDDYLVKPVAPDELQNAVDRMIIRNSLADNLQETLTLASKLAAIESKLPLHKLEESEEYHNLVSELHSPPDTIDLARENAGGDDYYATALLEKLQIVLEEATE